MLIGCIAAATGVVLLFNQVCVRLHEVARRRRYATQRRRRREIRAELRGIFGIPSSVPGQRTQGLLELLVMAHSVSVEAQNQYQRHVVRLAASLGIAFTAISLSVTLIHEPRWLRLLAALVDFVALSSVFYHFSAAKSPLASWIRQRTRTEFLRQYIFLSLLYPSLVESEGSVDLTSAFEEWDEKIDREVVGASGENLAEAIARFWDRRRVEIAGLDLCTGPFIDALRVYIDRRCLRQLAWFRASRERVQKAEKDRARSLSILYGITIVIALLKVLLLSITLEFNPYALEALALSLLVATGGAAAMSALYFGQNIRSLIHRYHAQERDMRHSVNTFCAALTSNPAGQPGETLEIREAIIGFEDLMIRELADWVHISRHDSVELGP